MSTNERDRLTGVMPRPAKETERSATERAGNDPLTDGLDDPLCDRLVDPLVQPSPSIDPCFGCVAGDVAANVVQMRDGGQVKRATDVHGTADAGLEGAAGTLPHVDRVQAAFGSHDIRRVAAHSGDEARQANLELGSEAFTRGEEVAFGSPPDLHTAAHEAAHVVQQRAGVSLPGGVGAEGDTHERHADAVADAVVGGGSAAALLDGYQGAGGAPTVQRKTIAKPAAKPGKPGGRAHPGAKGEKPFTKRELTWINEVLQHRLVKLLFASYSDVPTGVLHRVAFVAGAKGQFSHKNNDIAVADKVYTHKDTHTGKSGTKFTETNEEAFKGTLIHELFHFAEHNAKLRKAGLVLPSDLVQVLSKPKLAGFPDYAFGWFVHPKSSFILHFQLSDVVGFNPQTTILGDAKLMAVRKDTSKWERSPMPKSGNSISAEEDLCESISLALTSKRTLGVLASQYPQRYKLLNSYFGSLIKFAKKSLSKTP